MHVSYSVPCSYRERSARSGRGRREDEDGKMQVQRCSTSDGRMLWKPEWGTWACSIYARGPLTTRPLHSSQTSPNYLKKSAARSKHLQTSPAKDPNTQQKQEHKTGTFRALNIYSCQGSRSTGTLAGEGFCSAREGRVRCAEAKVVIDGLGSRAAEVYLSPEGGSHRRQEGCESISPTSPL